MIGVAFVFLRFFSLLKKLPRGLERRRLTFVAVRREKMYIYLSVRDPSTRMIDDRAAEPRDVPDRPSATSLNSERTRGKRVVRGGEIYTHPHTHTRMYVCRQRRPNTTPAEY